MDKYQRVPKDKGAAKEPVADDEIRITLKGKVRNYITYALALFQEKELRSVQLKAMGNAISKQVTVAEILKRRVAGLHQLNVITSTEVLDEYEPLEEGLDKVSIKRLLTAMEITLSLDELDTSQCGYQAPLPEGSVLSPEEAQAQMENRRRPRNAKIRRNNANNNDHVNEVLPQDDDGVVVVEEMEGLSIHEEENSTANESIGGRSNRRRGRGRGRGGSRGRGRRGERSNRRREDAGEADAEE